MITIDDLIRNSNLNSKLEEELFRVNDCGVLDVSKDIPISFIINKTKYQFRLNLKFNTIVEDTSAYKILHKLFPKDDIIAIPEAIDIKFDSFYDLRNKVYTLLTNLHEFFIVDFECFSHYNNTGCLYYRRRIKSSPDDTEINFMGFDIYSGQLYKSSKSLFNDNFIFIILYHYYSHLAEIKPNQFQVYLEGIKNYRSNIILNLLVNDEFKEISF